MLGLLSLSICLLTIAASTGSVHSQEFVNSFITDRHLYEGDIDLTPEQQAAMEVASNPNYLKRAVVRYAFKLWKNGQVPYRFDGSLDAWAKKAINEAIADYHDQTCIRFVPKTHESDYVEFYRGTGCHSYVGRNGGRQRISIGSGCEHKGIVIHEIFHSLGRWHEQSRPDRDRYVKINTNNIRSGQEHNFESKSRFSVTTQGVPYDYDSIMHYGAYDFSWNGRPTIEPVDRNVPLRRLGQVERLSVGDLEHINALYCKSASDKVASWSSWGSWSACSQSCNGGLRSRLRTCTGGSSCQGSNINSERCNTEPCAVPVEWGLWTSWSACSVTCGGGRQSRLRRCLHGNTCHGQNIQFRDCQTHDCLKRLQHINCYRLPEFNGTLQFLEGRVEEVSDKPSDRQQPVKKCAQAAEKLGYSLFAVSVNHCISGSNAVADYQTTKAGFCSDGVGGYKRGYYAMDVYWIANSETF